MSPARTRPLPPCFSRRSGSDRESSNCSNSGLTVFEVLLSVAIFMGSMVALGQLISSGRLAAQRGELQTEAVLRCETVVAQIRSGVLSPDSVDGSFPDDQEQRWGYTVLPIESPEVDLLGFEVTVSHVNNLGDVNYTFTLQTFFRDPQIYVDAAEAAAEAEAEAESSL